MKYQIAGNTEWNNAEAIIKRFFFKKKQKTKQQQQQTHTHYVDVLHL